MNYINIKTFIYAFLLFFQSIKTNFFLPPTEIAPLLDQKKYYYSRIYAPMEKICLPDETILNTAAFGLTGYICPSGIFGLWGLFEKGHFRERFIIAPSFSYSHIENDFFDFIDLNFRLGISSEDDHVGFFLYVGQACGMFYWLDVGWYGNIITEHDTHPVAGLYVKADHLVDHISIQVAVERLLTTGQSTAIHLLLEYDGSNFETSYAPTLQWWNRWVRKNTSEWACTFGINGCWNF